MSEIYEVETYQIRIGKYILSTPTLSLTPNMVVAQRSSSVLSARSCRATKVFSVLAVRFFHRPKVYPRFPGEYPTLDSASEVRAALDYVEYGERRERKVKDDVGSCTSLRFSSYYQTLLPVMHDVGWCFWIVAMACWKGSSPV